MIFVQSFLEGIGGNGSKAFQCAFCEGLISSSDRLIVIDGRNRHRFKNPCGIECDFHTFYACPGAVAVGDATDADTWFPGYKWTMAFCRFCGQHIGWYYERISMFEPAPEFWGILVSNTVSKP